MVIREVAEPEPAADEVIVTVRFSGICGSELGGYLGHNSLRKPPLIMGHEFAGEISALGSQASEIKPGLSVGQRVTVNPLIHRPWSKATLQGRQNLDVDRKIVGIHRPGSYAQAVAVPAGNVYPIPETLSYESAALTEPMACALRAVRLAGVQPTTTVLITGLGPIGLLALNVALESGARQVIATDMDPDRRAIGAEMGATVYDPRETEIPAAVRTATDGRGADVAIDAVGAHATRRDCIQAVAWGGKVIFTGLHEEESNIQANYIIRSEIAVQGSFAYTTLDFEDALQWLIDDRLQIEPYILKAPLAQGGECFERLLSKPGPVAKILLES
jgi:threonine dehydrogenase-like Zn-dependent dehydrogenase